MPLAVLLVLIDVVLIVHAAKTGRFSPWGYIILMLPGIGALAYVVVELIPEWFHGVQGQKARRHVTKTLDPWRRYRELSDVLANADTIANRTALAAECLELGEHEEARMHYEHVLALPMGDDPQFALGKARAEFGLGQHEQALSTLDRLRERWPDFQSAGGHLPYARALEELGRTNEALGEYHALAGYFPGAEAKVRYGLLLKKSGRSGEGRAVLQDVFKQFRRAPAYVRKAQAEWLATAEREGRGWRAGGRRPAGTAGPPVDDATLTCGFARQRGFRRVRFGVGNGGESSAKSAHCDRGGQPRALRLCGRPIGLVAGAALARAARYSDHP